MFVMSSSYIAQKKKKKKIFLLSIFVLFVLYKCIRVKWAYA